MSPRRILPALAVAWAISLLPACVTATLQPLEPAQRLESLLARVRAGRPLATGAHDRALHDSRLLVQPWTRSELEQLVALGHAPELVARTFRPAASAAVKRDALLAWLRDRDPLPGQDDREALIEALQEPLPAGRGESWRATRAGDRLLLTQRRWTYPALSMARALRATKGTPSAPQRLLLEDALVLRDP